MLSFPTQVLLWTGVTEQLNVQTIPGCAEMCPFEDFLDIVKDILPNDDEYYCRRDKTMDLKPNAHHRSSATCIADDRSWYMIFLTVKIRAKVILISVARILDIFFHRIFFTEKKQS